MFCGVQVWCSDITIAGSIALQQPSTCGARTSITIVISDFDTDLMVYNFLGGMRKIVCYENYLFISLATYDRDCHHLSDHRVVELTAYTATTAVTIVWWNLRQRRRPRQ